MNKVPGILITGLLVLVFALPATAVTLEDCLRVALDENPDLQVASFRMQETQARAGEAQAAYYPWLNSGVSYTRTDNPPQAFMMLLNQRSLVMGPDVDFNHPGDTENVRASVATKYRLFDGGRRGLDADMAGQGAMAAGAGRDASRNELAFQITRLYYGVLQAQAFTRVQEQTAASLEESLRVANERFKAGGTVQTDVLNLEVRLAQTREDLIKARNGIRLAVAALNTAIGRDAVTADTIEAPSMDVIPPLPTPAPEAWSNRPELQTARIRSRMAGQALSKANRAYSPTISAFGSVDWDSDVSTDFQNSYIAGAVAEWDLFTGFQRGYAVRAAGAQAGAARAAERQTENQLRLDLTQAGLMASEANERITVAQACVKTAEEALRITQARYQQGAADITELLTAQVGLTASRTRHVAAFHDYLTALANQERARGDLGRKLGQ